VPTLAKGLKDVPTKRKFLCSKISFLYSSNSDLSVKQKLFFLFFGGGGDDTSSFTERQAPKMASHFCGLTAL
jgi:hypothetical protein